MTETSRWALPLLDAGQAQKEMTHNEALARLDLLAQAGVQAVGVDAPPPGPVCPSGVAYGGPTDTPDPPTSPRGALTGISHVNPPPTVTNPQRPRTTPSARGRARSFPRRSPPAPDPPARHGAAHHGAPRRATAHRAPRR